VINIAPMYAVWRMELIITHLYGIMELMSRGESRAQDALLHALWPTIHGLITMENGNGETRCFTTGFQANDGLTRIMIRAMGTPNHLRLCQGVATPTKKLPCPTNKTVTYRYLYLCRGCMLLFSSFMSHGSRITTNGE
jgi:hypothetical protein